MGSNDKSIIEAVIAIKDAIIALGLIGNIISFIVFGRRAFAKTPIHIYFRSLAIFDSYLITQLVIDISNFILGYDITTKSDLACKLSYYLNDGLAPISGWILVAFSLDQTIAVYFHTNNKCKKLFDKTSFKIGIITFLAVFHIVLYAIVPVFVEITTVSVSSPNNLTFRVCDFQKSANSQLLAVFYLLESSVLPFVIMLVTTVLMAKSLYESSKSLGKSEALKRRKSKDCKFTRNSLFLNMMFIGLTSPLVISYIISVKDFYSDLLSKEITMLFFALNYSSHFVAHIAMNSVFRNELIVMFGGFNHRFKTRLYSSSSTSTMSLKKKPPSVQNEKY
jgi:hypothetical protein